MPEPPRARLQGLAALSIHRMVGDEPTREEWHAWTMLLGRIVKELPAGADDAELRLTIQRVVKDHRGTGESVRRGQMFEWPFAYLVAQDIYLQLLDQTATVEDEFLPVTDRHKWQRDRERQIMEEERLAAVRKRTEENSIIASRLARWGGGVGLVWYLWWLFARGPLS